MIHGIKKTRLRRAFILTQNGEVVGCPYPGGKYATKLYFLPWKIKTLKEQLSLQKRAILA